MQRFCEFLTKATSQPERKWNQELLDCKLRVQQKKVIQQRKHFFCVSFRLGLFEIFLPTRCKNCNWRPPKVPSCCEPDSYAWTTTSDDKFAKKFVTFPDCFSPRFVPHFSLKLNLFSVFFLMLPQTMAFYLYFQAKQQQIQQKNEKFVPSWSICNERNISQILDTLHDTSRYPKNELLHGILQEKVFLQL